MQNNVLTNRTVRRIFAAAIALIGVFTAVVVFASRAFLTIGDDGFAVPSSSGITQALSGEDGVPVSLVPVQYDDTVYKNILGYYVGEDRTPIDITYPLYTNGGVGLRFLDDANWLITPEIDLYQTYEGLYVSEGISYNVDMVRADEDTFVFLMLPNGLFMNVQGAVFENRLGTTTIPTNSILSLKENSIRWFEYKNGTLGLQSEEAVFEATLTIGEHTYDYLDLLKILGLVRDAITGGEGNKPAEPPLNDAEDNLPPNDPGDAGSGEGEGKPGEGEGNEPGEGGDGQTPDEGGDNPGTGGNNPGTGDNPGDGEDQPGEGGDQPGEGGDQPGEGGDQPGEGGDTPGEGGDAPGEGETPGEGGDTPGEDEDRPGEGGDTPGDGNDNPGDAGSGDGSETPGEGEENPGEGEDQPGEGEDQPGEGEDQPGEGGDTPGEGGDTPGEGGDQPGEGGDRPGEGGDTPGEGGDTPGEGGDTPGEGGDQPGEDEDQPGEGGDQPSEGGDNPGEGGDNPGEGGDQPGEGGDQPGEGDGEEGEENTPGGGEGDDESGGDDGDGDTDTGDDDDHTPGSGDHGGNGDGDETPDGGSEANPGEGADIPGVDVEEGEMAVRISLTAKKLLNYLEVTQDNIFTFLLYNDAAELIETVRNLGSVISFTDITFTEEGVYTYYIMEEEGDDPSILYDETVYTITIYIRRAETGLKAGVVLLKDDEEHDGAMIFVNLTEDYVPIDPGEDGETPGEGNNPDEGDGDNTPDEGDQPDEGGDTGTPGGSGGTSGGEDNDGEGSGDGDGEIHPDEGGTPGVPIPRPWERPVVTLSNIRLWCYAIDLHMEVDDPSAAIPRGVKIAVYSKLKGTGGRTGVDAEGHLTYSQEDYEGQSLLFRKTRSGTQDMALSPLKPGQTVYLQYSYRYYEEVKEMQEVTVTNPVTGLPEKVMQEVTTRKRVYYYSDYIELVLPTVEDSEIKSLAAHWETEFAGYSDAMSMTQFTLANTSSYDATQAEAAYDFENFKLNTLPYANRLILTLTPKGGGEPVVITINNSVLTRAQKGEASFKSTSPKLKSNTQYTMKVELQDRYGNTLPLLANGLNYAQYSETVYTRKQQPLVMISETENITDLLTVTLQISDPDGALDPGTPLYFSMLANEVPAVLYGTWGESFFASLFSSPERFGDETTTEIALNEPEDGKKYVLKLESLAFAQLFTARVRGTYYPQPDATTTPTLQPETDVRLGQLQIYTASLSEGYISFTTSFSEVLDTSAIISATMTSKTTIDVLKMVDEFRVYLKDENGKVINDHVSYLSMEEMSQPVGEGAPFVHENGEIVLEEGNHLLPKVYLYGETTQLRDTPWDSFNISSRVEINSATGEPETIYTSPMQLRIEYPTEFLTNFTRYSLIIEAVVVKGGQEYFIPINLTNTQFTTKKTIPVIQFEDLFIASDVASFVDLTILDPDATILNEGAIAVQLFYGNTLMSVQNIKADQTPEQNAATLNQTFEGLIAGADYTLKFVAAAYNDEAGYGAYRQNYTLATYNIVGGSDLTGDLNLTQLRNDPESEGNLLNHEDAITAAGTIADSSGFRKHSSYTSIIVPCEPATTYEITYAKTVSGTVYWSTFNTTAEKINGIIDGSITSPLPKTTYNGTSAIAPNYMRRFTSGANDNYMIISCTTSALEEVMKTLQVRVRRATGTTGLFNAAISVDVNDKKGYLGRGLGEGVAPSVKLTLERSESMDLPDYQPYATYILPLEAGEDGALVLNMSQVLESLPNSSAWRATLTCYYMNRDIRMDSITFRTDANYITVTNHAEFYNALANSGSYANILVTSDFEMDPNYGSHTLYGIVDFQGHVISKPANYNKHFISNVAAGAELKNLVVDYPKETYYSNTAAVIYQINGLVENFILRTYGQVEINSSTTSFVYYVTMHGTLRNFIYKLGGDVIMTNDLNSTYPGLLVSNVHGTVENGYIYGVGGAGFVQAGAGYSGLVGYRYYNNGIRNIYVLLDNWQRVNEEGQLYTLNRFLSCWGSSARGSFENVYTVGDFYAIGADMQKTYMRPLSSPLYSTITSANYNYNTLLNVWCISGKTVTPSGVPHVATLNKLHDVEWQKSMLGTSGAFDVEGSLEMGFYPRLNLPMEMQRYQEYIYLPSQGTATVPSVINDLPVSDPAYGNNSNKSAIIRLRVKNDNMFTITEVLIDNLVTSVLAQSMNEDGLYDVILSVAVDNSKESYLSSYHISELTYSVGSSVRSVQVNYDTSSFSFWKTVATVSDWHAINSNMDWNYKLIADLDFAGVAPGQIIVNGKLNNIDGTSRFTGNIDGQEHILKNISLENLSNPYVIYSLEGGSVKNLLIDHMTLTAAKSVKQTGVGFIFGIYTTAEIRNIHVRNSTIVGGGALGGILARADSGSGTRGGYAIIGCSVTDTTITDMENGNTVSAGGLVGVGGSHLRIQGCYTRDVDITVGNANNISATGGLIGSTGTMTIQSSYAHGSITSSGSYVGGIYGTRPVGDGMITRWCFSYVNVIQLAGDYAGGIAGRGGSIYHSVALGDVSSAGSSFHRISGTSATRDHVFAWEDQRVGFLTSLQNDDASSTLFTAEELSQKSTWQDAVQLGAAWDYSKVSEGYLPMVAAEFDCKNPEWQQVPIPQPGQNTDPSVRVIDAIYDANATRPYYLTLRLDHPLTDGATIAQMYADKTLTFDLEGMAISDADIDMNEAQILVSPSPSERYTMIQIEATNFDLAKDGYIFRLKYNDGKDRELMCMVIYLNRDGSQHINWIEVSSYDEWNATVAAHGKTEENILITSSIDFGNRVMNYNQLRFNRLSGKNAETCGFVNLRYTAGETGESWVDRVTMMVSDLHFKQCTFIFDVAKINRNSSGPFGGIFNAENLLFEDLTMRTNVNTSAYFGFFAKSNGVVQNITMNTTSLVGHATGTVKSYAGTLMGYSTGQVTGITATNVTVNMPRQNYVGGIMGFCGVWGGNTSNNSLTGVSVTGNSVVGGIFGITYGNSPNCSIIGIPETGMDLVEAKAGAAGGMAAQFASTSVSKGITVKNLRVKATTYAGGVQYATSHTYLHDVLVQNVSVSGASRVGGIQGYSEGSYYYLRNVQVLDCTITGTGDYVGGITGYMTNTRHEMGIYGVTIRNTVVTGANYVGGYAGLLNRNDVSWPVHRQIYIAEDVIVNGKSNYVGGFAGSSNRVALTDTIVGAQVNGMNNVGGVFGRITISEDDTMAVSMKNVIFAGKVLAQGDFAGGLVGKLDSPVHKFTDETLKNCLVTGSVNGNGDNCSLWINDTSTVGSAGKGSVYILETATLNGVGAKQLHEEAFAIGEYLYVHPETETGKTLFISESVLNTKAFWNSEMELNSKYWSITHIGAGDNIYLPFTTRYETDGVILHYTNHKSNDDPAGILLPSAIPTEPTAP